MRDGLRTHMTASFAAGFVATMASNLVDVIETRVMNMKMEPGAEPPYFGALACALKMKTVLCTLFCFFVFNFIYASPKKKKNSITYSTIWTNDNQV